MQGVIKGYWAGEYENIEVTCEPDNDRLGELWVYIQEEADNNIVGFTLTPEQAGRLIKIIRSGLRETKERQREREKYEIVADGIG